MPSWPNYIRLEADPSEGYVEIEYSLSVQDPEDVDIDEYLELTAELWPAVGEFFSAFLGLDSPELLWSRPRVRKVIPGNKPHGDGNHIVEVKLIRSLPGIQPIRGRWKQIELALNLGNCPWFHIDELSEDRFRILVAPCDKYEYGGYVPCSFDDDSRELAETALAAAKAPLMELMGRLLGEPSPDLVFTPFVLAEEAMPEYGGDAFESTGLVVE